MKNDDAPVLDGRRAFLGGLLGALVCTAVAAIILPTAQIKLGIPLFAGIMFGLPAGVAAAVARTSFRAAAWNAGFFGTVSAIVQVVMYAFARPHAPHARLVAEHLAFFITIVSTTTLSGGLSQIVCRAIPARGARPRPFQFSLAEAIVFSVIFAICLSGGLWLARLVPGVIRG